VRRRDFRKTSVQGCGHHIPWWWSAHIFISGETWYRKSAETTHQLYTSHKLYRSKSGI
jgi:hypothetical protein